MKHLIIILLFIPIISFGQDLKSFNSKDGTEIFYQVIGEGETIVFLTGGPGLNPDIDLYESLYSELKKKYRCIILHQRGTGKSLLKEVNENTVNVDRYNEDLNGLFNHLGGRKLILVGHSWGGMLSFSYASNEPDKISKIILLGTGDITGSFFTWFSSNIRMRLNKEDLELEELQIKNKRESMVAIWPGYFFSRSIALQTRPPLDYKFRNQDGINSFAVKDWRKKSEERVEKLKSFKASVYLVTGRQDPGGNSIVYEVKSILPQTSFLFIEECGHFPWIEGEKQSKIFYEFIDKSIMSN